MNGLRGQLLAGAAVSRDQYRRVGVGRTRDQLVHLQHARRSSQQSGIGSHLRLRLAGGLRRPVAQRALHGGLDGADFKRFADEVERAGTNGVDRRLERAEAADENHRGRRALGGKGAKHVESRTRRVQVQIGDEQIERRVLDSLDRGVGIVRRRELAPR